MPDDVTMTELSTKVRRVVRVGVTCVGDAVTLDYAGPDGTPVTLRVGRHALSDAMVPIDDGVPIDAAWLETVGGRLNYLKQWEWLYGADGHHLSVIRGAPPGWSCDVVSTDSAVELPPITTRGQLRRLLAALGVPAAEGGAPCPS